MKKGVKEMIIRALRTFFQAAVGYLAANIVLIKWDDPGVAKTTALTVITAAVACGLAALMNLPRSACLPLEGKVSAPPTDEVRNDNK